MSRDELINQLLELQTLADTEAAHSEADSLLLEYIGDEEIQAAYADIKKWYA